MERLGFYICAEDLEDELIRSFGVVAVERLIRAQGELGLLRTFQTQPAWRGRTNEEQLGRFFGTHKGRNPIRGPARRGAGSHPRASRAGPHACSRLTRRTATPLVMGGKR